MGKSHLLEAKANNTQQGENKKTVFHKLFRSFSFSPPQPVTQPTVSLERDATRSLPNISISLFKQKNNDIRIFGKKSPFVKLKIFADADQCYHEFREKLLGYSLGYGKKYDQVESNTEQPSLNYFKLSKA